MKLSWLGIVRLGAVQMALGAIVVLMTSTLNRLMVVELALPAVLPGALVALHYGVQITRPSWGFFSDTGGRRTFWILAGTAILGLGGVIAAFGIWVFETHWWAGISMSIFAYILIGLGVGASGTSLLALLATATEPRRRAAAATITWLMMIAGIAVTAVIVGSLLDPYSPQRLIQIVTVVVLAAVALTALATWRIESGLSLERPTDDMPFIEGLREVWQEKRARDFTFFVFLSMTAYFMQELILEPYAGLVFGFTPGQSTSLSGAQNGGVFLGMITVGIACTGLKLGSLRAWVIGGCIGSAAMLTIISLMGTIGAPAPLQSAVIGLGFFNGVFAVAAIGSMMGIAGSGRAAREGTRMGLWGAAQALAAGFGGLAGAGAVDVLRFVTLDATAFGIVFVAEAFLFLASAYIALRVLSQKSNLQSAAIVPGE